MAKMTKEEGQRLHSRLRWEVTAIGADDSDEPELAIAWEGFYSGDDAVATAAEQILFTYRTGGNRNALSAEWAIVRKFADRRGPPP
jgi:hypothetical protein